MFTDLLSPCQSALCLLNYRDTENLDTVKRKALGTPYLTVSFFFLPSGENDTQL